ncbi:MAG: type III pantothenate kinase [Acidobacteriota bacterium]
MLLAVDIGNSAIKFGIFDGDTLLSRSMIPAKRDYTNDAILAAVDAGLDLPVENALVCSVVPELDETVSILIAEKCGVNAEFVRNDMDFGLGINYKPLSTVGSDRLVNSFAAAEKYGVPCIVCSFGTATTFDVVNSKRELIGGLIAPGMATMAKALHLNTAQLPEVTLERPPSIIAVNTVDSIRSGVFYGQISMIEGIVNRIFEQLGKRPTVIATGGFAETVEDETGVIDIVDENLLLEGLNLLFKRLYTGSDDE